MLISIFTYCYTIHQTLMKNFLFLIVFATSVYNSYAQIDLKKQIDSTLDGWHKAASEANFHNYFGAMTDDAIFIGTDATENWNKSDFQTYAKPYFDAGKAWSFTSIQRNIYFSADKKTAWFDELLSTQMKICRGSGVLVLEKGQWKIKHYVLSMTIPNDNSDEVVKIKSPLEDKLIMELKK